MILLSLSSFAIFSNKDKLIQLGEIEMNVNCAKKNSLSIKGFTRLIVPNSEGGPIVSMGNQ